MDSESVILYLTAAAVAAVHVLLGPDHYLPFVAIGRARRWSLRKTLVVTITCGIGHVLGSVAIGTVGVALGVSLLSVESIESSRGAVAGWLLLAFGLVYFVWGVRRGLRHRPHAHWHAHANGTVHTHEHVHAGEHIHVHESGASGQGAGAASLTPWAMFVIFLFGPCEPLIPLLMYPAAQGRTVDAVLVAAVFALVTVGVMVAVVALAHSAAFGLRSRWLERYAHAFAGLVVLSCGAAVTLGL